MGPHGGGHIGEDINPWGAAMFGSLQGFEPGSAVEEANYAKWLDQTESREIARQDRIHGAAGIMPSPLWIVLFFIAAIIFVFLLGMADSGERPWVPPLFMGSVVAVIAALLLLLGSSTIPYTAVSAGCSPSPWNARCCSSISNSPSSAATCRSPATRVGHWRDGGEPSAGEPRQKDWVEIAATVLLAVAAVATAWSSYQANRWNGETTKATGRVNALRIEAARAQGLAEAQTEVDIAMFFQWANAEATDEADLADFYIARFRPDFRPAFDAWLDTDPLTDPDAPPTPFAMDEYELPQQDSEARQADAAAEVTAAEVRRNIQRSANYVSAVVLFAVALFFAGMSTKLRGDGVRKVLLIVGCLIFLGTAAWIATFPVSLSV